MPINRRNTLIIAASAAFAALLGFAPVAAQEGTTKDVGQLAQVAIPDVPLGSAEAPVTVIEYASPSCPHCARFHAEVFPAFKEAYVDTGKVQFVLRPFVRDGRDAAVFLLAQAAGPEQFHHVVETFMATQNQWVESMRPRDAILAIATQLGFTEPAFEAALSDTELAGKLTEMRVQAIQDFDLTGTPTFYVNGQQLTGDKTVEELAAVIDPLVPADFQPPATETEGTAGEAAATEPDRAAETDATAEVDGAAEGATEASDAEAGDGAEAADGATETQPTP